MESLKGALVQDLSAACLGALDSIICDALPWSLLGANCAGIRGPCAADAHMLGIPPTCASALTGEACKAGVSQRNMGALATVAASLSQDCLGNLSSAACGVMPDSFLVAIEDHCSQLSPKCVANFSTATLAQLPFECELAFDSSYWEALSLDQILALDHSAFSIFSGSLFANLVKKHGTALVAALKLEQLSSSAPDAVADFVLAMEEPDFPPAGYTFPNASFGADATWLQLAWSTNGGQLLSASENVRELPAESMAGIVPGHHVTSSAVGAMSNAQLRHISCIELKSWSPELLTRVADPSLLVWPRFERPDSYLAWNLTVWVPLWQQNAAVLNSMGCKAIIALPESFLPDFLALVTVDATRKQYQHWRQRGSCLPGEVQNNTVPCSGWRRPNVLMTFKHSTTTAAPMTTPRKRWNRRTTLRLLYPLSRLLLHASWG